MSASQKGAAQSVISPGKIECHIECSEKRTQRLFRRYRVAETRTIFPSGTLKLESAPDA